MKGKRVKNSERLSYKEYRAMVETPGLRKARKISKVFFVGILLALILALTVGGILFLNYSRKSFMIYENSQISYVEDAVIARLNEADARELMELLPSRLPDGSEFDEPEEIQMEAYSSLAEKEMRAEAVRNTENENRKYALYSGEELLGFYELACVSSETRLAMLTCENWEYAGGEAIFNYHYYSRFFTIPEGFSVLLNGKPVGDSYRVGEAKEIDRFRRVMEFEDMPEMVTLSVHNLLKIPEIEIIDNLGNSLALDTDAEEIILPEQWSFSEPSKEMEAWILDAYKLWSEYCLLDRTLSEVQALLIPNSSLWEEVLLSDSERWWIDSHQITGYENEQVSEYTVYNENCFSCRVSMDRHIFSTTIQQDVPDFLDDIVYFVRRDFTEDGLDNPNWYLVDICSAG